MEEQYSVWETISHNALRCVMNKQKSNTRHSFGLIQNIVAY